MLSLRRNGIKVPYDERVLGNGEFLQHLLEDVEERERETLRLSKKVKDLDSLAEKIARKEGLTEEKLRSGSRAKRISSVRRLFCQLAVGKMGYSGAQIARFLGVTTSAVNRAANSEDHETLHRYQ